MRLERFSELIDKYKANSYSASERDELLAMLVSGQYHEQLAKTIALDLESGTQPAVLHPEKAQQILQAILASGKPIEAPIHGLTVRTRLLRIAAAAAIAGVIAVGAYFILASYPTSSDQVVTALKTANTNNRKNSTALPEKIRLEDGSVVTLQPGASLHYATHFAAGKREVYLDGEAFFEITKNPNRPFFVYHNKLVTQVLGTSFNVKIDKRTNNVEVAVKTGRVQVYEQLDSVTGNNRQSNGVILTPNQKVLYVGNNSLFVPMLVETPLPIKTEDKKPPPIQSFLYERANVSEIITELEKIYGVDIIPENDAMSNCLFTGDLSDPNLFTKLDVLCTVVKATYEVKGTQILLKGRGCN